MEPRLLATMLQEQGFDALLPFADPAFLLNRRHGDLPRWLELLGSLPELVPSELDLKNSVTIGKASDSNEQKQQAILKVIEAFIPWRKGPFNLFGLEIDSEWNSGLKWQRLVPHICPLGGRRVLDVGCGNGYHCLLSSGAGASLVLGIEPYLPYVMQFQVLGKYLAELPCQVLPLALEELPDSLSSFDSVFSMGVLYHQHAPIDHLLRLAQALRPGGQLILETLTVEGPEGHCLVPNGRYARMPNVRIIPSGPSVLEWLGKSGFEDCRIVDHSRTTTREQRQTRFMPFESLSQALDPMNPGLTVEGYPAPNRTIIIATRSAKVSATRPPIKKPAYPQRARRF